MAATKEKVLEVEHYTDRLFKFTTTRNKNLRFREGEFIMIGLDHFSEKLQRNKPIMRAYSVISPSHQETLEFLSIKVQDGPLTSRLQHLKQGDKLLVSRKPVGTLVLGDLTPAKNLYLFSTGTGIAPFMSIIKDPETYERFEKIVLVHGVRYVSELAYNQHLTEELLEHEYLADEIKERFIYYPTVTREDYKNQLRSLTS